MRGDAWELESAQDREIEMAQKTESIAPRQSNADQSCFFLCDRHSADRPTADVPADRLGASLTIKPSAVTRDQVAERCDDEGEYVEARTEAMARTIARRRERGESGSESESEEREQRKWSNDKYQYNSRPEPRDRGTIEKQ
ncbi:hypothetical protein B0H14DRAFT_2593937 [Mycena olivaceomarginata]|nr:hypothetical protein B0H14DRAFT_2593937 [Mycena olivaceomarginata]